MSWRRQVLVRLAKMAAVLPMSLATVLGFFRTFGDTPQDIGFRPEWD